MKAYLNKRIWLGMVGLWIGGFGMGWMVHKLVLAPKTDSQTINIQEMMWTTNYMTPDEVKDLWANGIMRAHVYTPEELKSEHDKWGTNYDRGKMIHPFYESPSAGINAVGPHGVELDK